MEKILITTIRVNLVSIPSKLEGGNTNFPEFLLLKILPLCYHCSHFWAATFDFTTFFDAGMACTFFTLSIGCFYLDNM